MYTSMATVSISGTLREKLEAIALAGFSGVELFETDLISFDGTIDDVRQLVADLGLDIVLFQPFRDFEAMPEPYRQRNFERAKHKFDLMNRLGVDLILVCSNVSPKCLGGIDRSVEDFSELGDLAQSFGVRIGYEALAWGKFVSDYRDAWEIVRRTNHPNVGTIVDSFHILTRKQDLSTLRAIPQDRIFLVQIADAPSLDIDILSLSRHFRSFPGQGELPLTDFMAAVQATGYNGIYSLEIFNDRFRAAPVQQTAADGRRSLIFLDEQASKTPAPERPEFGQIEFVEFALNEETAQALRDVLKVLGFHHWGIHHTKAVEVWKNGGVQLVINLEPDSFAQSYNLMNGSSVCAVGMHVSDAELASQYAEKYLCKKVEQTMFPNEMQVPAIRNLDESLIYFIDDERFPKTIWEAEFELVTEKDPAAATLTHIDHIAQLMPPSQLPSWLLFYHSVFGFEPTQPLDIADPAGLIQSQVVESPGQQVRIVLNTSQNQDTLASRFLMEHIVGGVQHIAFATNQIFNVAEKLMEQGVALLPIPENYYDDLEARFDLDLDLLSHMKKYNILYDRSEDGEFFQIYTQTIANRFFFEVVERRNYESYGAPNTPIRLAAQARLSQPRYPIAYESSSLLAPQKLMKAAMLTAPRQISITTVPVPIPRYGEVRIKMKSVGICGSDVHLFSGHRSDLIYPKIIGHEGYGYVEMLGEGVKHLAVGDRVVIEPNYPCMACKFCLQGRGSICPNKRIIGVLEQGCFAEYAIVPEPFAWKVPPAISDDDAVVIEPTAVALHAILTSRACPGDTMAVVGLGPIGMLVTDIAIQLGYRVIATDIKPEKEASAKEIGAIICTPDQWEKLEVVAVIECSGSANALSDAIANAPRGSEVIVVGLSEKDSSLSEFQVARRGISLVPSLIYDHPQDFKRTIQLIASGKIRPGKIISRRLSFSNVDESLEIASQGLDTKVIMNL
jgi:4-hydroxyphenylpyruvate dioxygenase